MDRRSHCNNINRNTSHLFNRIKNGAVRNNLVAPEVFVSEIWMQEGTTNGVEIIELNSSNSEIQESLQEPSNTLSQAWNFLNHDTLRDTEEDYRINNIARERRRKNGEEEWSFPCTNEYLHDTQTNFNGFHYNGGSKISEFPHSQEMNCFTIINNHVINSDSSSDKVCAKVEEIQPLTENNNSDTYWDHVYKEDIITYEPMNPENRTVWIYSFKNKRRLSENDFELVNIPSIDSSDTSTISPMSDEEYRTDRSTNVFRIASPIPATFIPRLDLSLAQTLSTVTEISEVKNSSHESLVIKPINNWFTERTIPNSKIEIPSVVNWMALSPRERRRRFKNTNSDVDHRANRNRREQFTYAEGNTQSEQPKEKSPKMSFSQIQVDVDVHAYDIPVINSVKSSDVEIVSKESLEMEPQVEYKFANTLSNEITHADADTEIDNEIGDDNFDPTCRKPCIQLTSEKTFIISEPIEKLNSSKWIVGEDTIEEQTAVFDYVVDVDETENKSIRSNESDSVSKRLWINNAKLMKPPLWTEYLPITETPPSLHLSLSLSSIEGKKSWFKRIGKCFKCCK